MTSPHIDPDRNGQRFGRVLVTVDVDAGDCVVHSFVRGPCDDIPRRMHLHSIEELQGAYQVQFGLGATDPIAADNARALKFAGERLKNTRGR
jgi:hypothetical protein